MIRGQSRQGLQLWHHHHLLQIRHQCKKSTLNVEVQVTNDDSHKVACSLYTWVADRNGVKLSAAKELTIALNAGEEKTMLQSFNVPDPVLWSLENPYLHRVVVELNQNGTVIDR